MKLVAAVVISAFFAIAHSEAQENSTLLTQLTGKTILSSIFGSSNDFTKYIVYGYGENGLAGLGVAMPNEMVLIHSCYTQSEYPGIVVVKSRAAPIELISNVNFINLMKIKNTKHTTKLKTLPYPEFYTGDTPKGLETHALGVKFSRTVSNSFEAVEDIRIGKIEAVIDGIIYVHYDEETSFEGIGDPLFVSNKLFGILIETRDSAGIAKYQEVIPFESIVEDILTIQHQGP